MIDFHITLVDRTGATRWGWSGDAAPAIPAFDPGRRRFERHYRSFLADASWLPQTPVRVVLARSARNARSNDQDFELEFFPESTAVREKPGRGRVVMALAAFASILSLPRPALAADGTLRNSPPPSVNSIASDHGASETGPPTRHLVRKVDRKALEPLRGRDGKPVLLSPFHTNTPAAAHGNAAGVHTNMWSNHSNVAPGSGSQQSVHANLPPYTVPHTNITPGDWVF